MVDCRDCRFFVPVERMSDDELAMAYRLYSMSDRHRSLKGWCRKRRDVVTYFEGRCSLFKRRSSKARQTTVEEWVKHG